MTAVTREQAKYLNRARRLEERERGRTYGISRAAGFDASAGAKGCRFPLWPHDAKPDGRFCGKQPRALGEPYCATHRAVCYRKPLAMSVPER